TPGRLRVTALNPSRVPARVGSSTPSQTGTAPCPLPAAPASASARDSIQIQRVHHHLPALSTLS
ncbi:hypothetical protein MHYP_G00157460, partial [Metynnis hypsauchen]